MINERDEIIGRQKQEMMEISSINKELDELEKISKEQMNEY